MAGNFKASLQKKTAAYCQFGRGVLLSNAALMLSFAAAFAATYRQPWSVLKSNDEAHITVENPANQLYSRGPAPADDLNDQSRDITPALTAATVTPSTPEVLELSEMQHNTGVSQPWYTALVSLGSYPIAIWDLLGVIALMLVMVFMVLRYFSRRLQGARLKDAQATHDFGYDASTPTFAQAAHEFSHDAFTSLFAQGSYDSNDDEATATFTESLKVSLPLLEAAAPAETFVHCTKSLVADCMQTLVRHDRGFSCDCLTNAYSMAIIPYTPPLLFLARRPHACKRV